VSLQPDHERALRLLSEESGLENVSIVIQDLLAREMFSRFGPRWRLEVRKFVTLPPELVPPTEKAVSV